VIVVVPEGAAEFAAPSGWEVVSVAASGALPDACGDARAVVLGPPLGPSRAAELLGAVPPDVFVQATSAGVEWLLPIVRPGMTVANASGVHDGPVSEWCVAVILAMERKLPAFFDLQRSGRWDADVNDVTARAVSPLAPIDDLEGKRVLVLGHGSIGRALSARLEPFGVSVTGVTSRGPFALAELAAHVAAYDVVVVLLPLTPATRGVVSAEVLRAMRPGALLVNAGRGAHVDHDALLGALHGGHVRAALDVTDPEPLPPGHPLWSAPGVLVTPHVAGSSVRWRARAYALAARQLARLARGAPPVNVVAGP